MPDSPAYNDGNVGLSEVAVLNYSVLVNSAALRYLYADDSIGEQAIDIDHTKPDGSPLGGETVAGHEKGGLKIQLAKNDDALPRPGHILFTLGKYFRAGAVAPARVIKQAIQSTIQVTRLYNPVILGILSADGDPFSLAISDGVAMTAFDAGASNTRSAGTIAYAATGLPSGLSINASTGEITGTPSGAGTYTVTVTVTDVVTGENVEDNRANSQSFEIVVS